jgi:hypothetical protein
MDDGGIEDTDKTTWRFIVYGKWHSVKFVQWLYPFILHIHFSKSSGFSSFGKKDKEKKTFLWTLDFLETRAFVPCFF